MAGVDHFLDAFFNPESVAIVGATNNPLKMNFRLLENLVNLKYDGLIYPVNPHAKEILGIKAFARLKDIPGNVDLIVSAVPVQHTMDVVTECKEIGAKQLVIVSGGFSEGGESGRALHEQLALFVKENGIRTLGPNTLSPVNTVNNFAISFNPIRKLSRGGLSFAFQSGFYEPIINWLFSHLGINKMLDMGNKLDINEVDALEYFERDPDTEILAMHIESIRGHGRGFYKQLRSIAQKKPVIILKSGRTPSGSKAAASHTGSLAGENDAVDEDTDCAIMQLMPWSFHESTNSREQSEVEIDPLRQMYIQWLAGIQKSGKPFALWCSSSGTDGQRLIEQIESCHIPVFPSSERAIKALSALNGFRSRRL